ncbi:hypothetical protein [uncultured Dokdonia sp.]|uniref:hypothetical protein n=1 Tax=uncultured Dokdonia sp. TaxID=575653 RepID=UPI00260B4963|nr:hypothetical protein [uncultured Dokdonia sp.]
MCQVRFTVETENNMEPILSGQGRYRRVGDQTWIDFDIDLSDIMTPNITIVGNYELEVRVSYEAVPTALDWSLWRGSTFKISEDGCDDSVYYYAKGNQTIGAL